MRTSWKLAILASSVFCLLWVVVPSPSSAQWCGPGGAACGGGCNYGETCDGVYCVVPPESTISPGYCTAEQTAAGGRQYIITSGCQNGGSGGCACYLPPSQFQIIRDCSIQSATAPSFPDETKLFLATGDLHASDRVCAAATGPTDFLAIR